MLLSGMVDITVSGIVDTAVVSKRRDWGRFFSLDRLLLRVGSAELLSSAAAPGTESVRPSCLSTGVELPESSRDGQDTPDGAEEGPGVKGAIDIFIDDPSKVLRFKGAVLGPWASFGAERTVLRRHSLHAAEASIGVRLRRPTCPAVLLEGPAKSDENSCSCIIKFMFGPIHLLRFLTVS